VDSALTASMLLDEGAEVAALFIDYGQPAADAERSASCDIARTMNLPWRDLTVRGLLVQAAGEIPGRNDLLIASASACFPHHDVALGVHAGTGYPDCSPAHRQAWQQLLDVQHGGTTRLLTPLIDLTKGEVFALAARAGLPLDKTHSCESSNQPCGTCRSCKDRESIVARA
jgi:7-cyano-7-deazaguanine synthase